MWLLTDSEQISDDEYLHAFAADALQASLSILRQIRPGRLVEFAVHRSDRASWVSVRFILDARPGVEFSYQHPVASVGREPQMSAGSAAGIFMSALIERTERQREAVEGVIVL